ncbi:hypothetical protein [Paenibacillus ferrarius]|nr:hypothetical protein [Paenibacillus ferrarius]
MSKYEMDETTLKNLTIFLGRVNLTGAEVGEFNKIIQALSNPIPENIEK